MPASPTRLAAPLPAAPPPGAAGNSWAGVVVPLAAFMLTGIGLSGVGDAPNPQAPGVEIADWFGARSELVLRRAPAGYAGAVLIAVTAAQLARRLTLIGRTTQARQALCGGALSAAYFGFCHIAWSAIAFDRSVVPDIAKAGFIATVLAVPMLSLGVSMAMLASANLTANRLWRLAGIGIATLTMLGIVSVRTTGFLSADVQQQVATNVLLAWLLLMGFLHLHQLAPRLAIPFTARPQEKRS